MAKSGEVFEVVYRNTVYELEIRRTNKVPNIKRPKKSIIQDVLPINTEDCDKCGSLKFNGICMNTKCI